MPKRIKRMWSNGQFDALFQFFTRLNELRSFVLAARLITAPQLTLAGNFQVGHAAFHYQTDGTSDRVNTLKAPAQDATGVALAAGTVPANLWGAWLVRIELASGTKSTVAAAANATGYASEAAAIAAVPAVADGYLALGYVTVRANAAQPFIPGTDALEGGTGGNVAQTTNYYDAGQNYPLTVGEELEAF